MTDQQKITRLLAALDSAVDCLEKLAPADFQKSRIYNQILKDLRECAEERA